MIGSGKTTLGKAIADRLGWPFRDLDRTMESEAGKPFHEVVAEEGWLGFRQREYNICKCFAVMDRSVIALGGGTVRYEWNRDILKGTGVRILLIADLNVLADRVRMNDRPRVNPGTALEEDLKKIWDEHKGLYFNFADIIYATDKGKTVSTQRDEVLELLRTKNLLTSSRID
ncbi:MAG: shikimate kinase, partial [Deltaproteobacteria bacterium]|nr:shikimate kinase [Deltaproteobacteria bacterium]